MDTDRAKQGKRGWKARTEALEEETYALYLACRDPRVPWYAKALAAAVAGYALSPIDLIPDFIPVLGYLDDLVIVPAGIALALRLVPGEVMAECRARAKENMAGSGGHRAAAVVIVAVWIIVLAVVGVVIYRAAR